MDLSSPTEAGSGLYMDMEDMATSMSSEEVYGRSLRSLSSESSSSGRETQPRAR